VHSLRLLVWHYYEHIVRGEEELRRIRQYIQENPARWEEDENQPENIEKERVQIVDLNQGLTQAIEDLKGNWQSYRKRFMKGAR